MTARVLEFGSLEERVERFSRTPCPRTVVHVAPRAVVLAPPMRPVEHAFSVARSLLDEGVELVRVIGTCAPLEASWPDWVRQRAGVVATEIGAYRAQSRIVSTRELASDVHHWLARMFGPFGGVNDGFRSFYSEACSRIFDPLLMAHSFVGGLARGLAGCRVRCTEEWTVQPALDALLAVTGGGCSGPGGRSGPASRRSHSMFALEASARAAVYTVGAIAEVVREYARSAPSRAQIEDRRAPARDDPHTWVTLIPTSWRMNRHVIQSFVEPEVARGAHFGTLLFGELARGERTEQDLRVLAGNTLWSGLRGAREAILRRPVEQVVGPESLVALASTVLRAVTRAAISTYRLVRSPRTLVIGEYRVDLADHIEQAAKLASVAVVRATAVELATRAAARRHSMDGALVVMATSGMVETSMLDVTLQSLGATTVEFVHGAQGDGLPGTCESCSTHRVVWTLSECRAEQDAGRSCVAAGMPVPALSPRLKRRAGKNVLIMSSYTHLDQRTRGRYPQLSAQHELLNIVDAFALAPTRGVKFRWRPHPADNPEEVARAREAHPAMEVSHGTTLEVDLLWCDAVVSVPSSALFEALFAGVPVFLHAPPEVWGTAVTDCLEPERVFYWTADGVAALSASLARLDAADELELDPERTARVRLFGPTGEPQTLCSALAALCGDRVWDSSRDRT